MHFGIERAWRSGRPRDGANLRRKCECDGVVVVPQSGFRVLAYDSQLSLQGEGRRCERRRRWRGVTPHSLELEGCGDRANHRQQSIQVFIPDANGTRLVTITPPKSRILLEESYTTYYYSWGTKYTPILRSAPPERGRGPPRESLTEPGGSPPGSPLEVRRVNIRNPSGPYLGLFLLNPLMGVDSTARH